MKSSRRNMEEQLFTAKQILLSKQVYHFFFFAIPVKNVYCHKKKKKKQT